MRRIGVILAGAALALALVSPAVAGATEKASNGTTITAQGFHGGHGGHGGHGFSHGFSRHDHDRFFFHRHPGCWGCGFPFWFYGYPYGYYGYPYGYYPGGFGCNFDYPCGPPYPQNSCPGYSRSSRSAQPPANAPCPAAGSNGQAPPPRQAQPAPSQGQQPPADQGMGPGPDESQQPAPAQGGQY